jgi:hypothetical protein
MGCAGCAWCDTALNGTGLIRCCTHACTVKHAHSAARFCAASTGSGNALFTSRAPFHKLEYPRRAGQQNRTGWHGGWCHGGTRIACEQAMHGRTHVYIAAACGKLTMWQICRLHIDQQYNTSSTYNRP